jgi:hypothetical protein
MATPTPQVPQANPRGAYPSRVADHSSAVWGVHPKTSSRLTLVSTLNRADDYNDCDGRGLTTKFAKSVLAEP